MGWVVLVLLVAFAPVAVGSLVHGVMNAQQLAGSFAGAPRSGQALSSMPVQPWRSRMSWAQLPSWTDCPEPSPRVASLVRLGRTSSNQRFEPGG
jgi:hypothetical protein